MAQATGKMKMFIGGLAALLVVSVAGNIYYWNKSHDLMQERVRIEQQANALISTQNLNIDRLHEQVEIAQENKESLQEEVQELNASLSQVNSEIWELRTRRARHTTDVDLLRSANQLELAGIQSKTSQLSDENGSLLQQNDQLNQRLALLQDSLQALVENTLTADGFRMVAYKRNNKETAKAKKVDRLTVSLDIPPALGLRTREVLYLSLTDMYGNGVVDPLQNLTVSTPEEEVIIPVHDSRVVDFSTDKNRQQVTFFVYRSDSIKPGKYRASVYTKDKYLGSVELQFRDSFWFF